MISTYTIDLPNEQATNHIAIEFASCLIAPLVVTFSGQIGAGKTAFIRAMLRELGIRSTIKSPTFSIVESYSATTFCIHHFDLYRISAQDELNYIGFRDYFLENAICCIEWPEKAGEYLDDIDINFSLDIKGTGRELKVSSYNPRANDILFRLLGKLALGK